MKWYVEAYDRFSTHNGGFSDISEPFETEAEARVYAESLTDTEIALYKVENDIFEHVDDFTPRGEDRPRGWHKDVTEEAITQHQQAGRDKFKAEQDALEHSGVPVQFWVFQNGFFHRPYSDRSSAERVVERINTKYPHRHAEVLILGPGSFPGRIFPVEGVDDETTP